MVAQKSDGHVLQDPKNLIVHLLLFMVAHRVIMKSLDPLRAKKIVIRKKLGHTAEMAMYPKSKEGNWLFMVAQKIGSHVPQVPKKLLVLVFKFTIVDQKSDGHVPQVPHKLHLLVLSSL